VLPLPISSLKSASPEAKAHPEVFAHKTVGQVADHFADLIGQLDDKPAVIRHSFA
jgi:non-heme chloroperoxidase